MSSKKKPKYEQIDMICTACNGNGVAYNTNQPCPICNGTGIVPIAEAKSLLEAERVDNRQLLVDRPDVVA